MIPVGGILGKFGATITGQSYALQTEARVSGQVNDPLKSVRALLVIAGAPIRSKREQGILGL